MAVGDVVGGTFAAGVPSNYRTFQPAAGVEVIFLSMCGDNTAQCILYDGTNQAWSAGNADAFGTNLQIKVPVNNTQYCQFYSGAADPCGYRGIQIK